MNVDPKKVASDFTKQAAKAPRSAELESKVMDFADKLTDEILELIQEKARAAEHPITPPRLFSELEEKLKFGIFDAIIEGYGER